MPGLLDPISCLVLCLLARTPVRSLFPTGSPAVVSPWLMLGGLLLGLGLAGLYLYHRRRLRQAVDTRIRAMQAQLARDFHDELGGKLTVITLYGELARQALDADGPPAARGHVEKVLGATRQLYGSMKDMIWSLHPDRGRDDDDLWERLRRRGEDLFAPTGAAFHLAIDERARTVQWPPGSRRHLLLLVQEALHNACRHAQARRVRLAGTARRDALIVEVQDDGVGFNPRQAEPGEGLRNMRLRARRLGGTLTIRSDGRGSTIRLRCPLPGPDPYFVD